VVNRHEKRGPSEQVPKRMDLRVHRPAEKNVIFTWRNVLFRGFLEEEEDWKKSEDMERMGRVWRRRWNWIEEEGRGGRGDRGRKDVPGGISGLGTELVYYNGYRIHRIHRNIHFWVKSIPQEYSRNIAEFTEFTEF